MKLYDYLLNAAAEVPDKIAFEFGGRGLPFSYFAIEAKKVAAGLIDLGLQPQESVGVMLPNLPPFIGLHYGTMMAGGVFVPMNVMLQGQEIEYLIRDSDIKVLVTYELFLDNVNEGIKNLENPPTVFVLGEKCGDHRLLQELYKEVDEFEPVVVDDDLPAMRLYTSGTTGKPKGAQITNANVIANLTMTESVLPVEPEDKSLCVLPLFHCFALNGVMNSAVRNQTAVVLHPRFDVEACIRSLSEDGITTFAGVPTMYFNMLKHPSFKDAKFPRLKHCVSGGAAMPVEVLTQWEELTGKPVYEGYGLTETTVSVCINRPGQKKVGSIGLTYPDVQLKIVDDNDQEVPTGEKGEIVIKAPNVMLGYLNKPEETAEALRDGWFYTGDIGLIDDDGFIFIVDRKKDMIIKGGFNIYPREIEEVIFQLPEVAEAAVIGIYDDAKGELVRAVIAFKPDQSLTEEQVRGHLSTNLAKYKLPNDYVFIDELPKGPTGKILKRELRARWEQWNKDRVSESEAKAPVAGS